MNKYLLQPSSTHPGYWVLTDTEHGIVVSFEDGCFNETQKATFLGDKPRPTAEEFARIMQELGDWAVRHHGSRCFGATYGFEYGEDNDTLYLYRRKHPRWRMKIEDRIDATHLAGTLRKAAEFLTKRQEK